MPPGDRIRLLFEEQIEPLLKEHNFKFIKSKNLFKRKVGQFTQEISISSNKWNRADEVCSFWLIFSVIADNYNAWHKTNYGTFPLNDCVTSFYHNHLKKWETEYKLDKYDLSKQDNYKVFKEIQSNLLKLVLPLFDNYSTYEKAADTLMKNKEYWWGAKIFDYYQIAGKTDKAKQTLKLCKEYFAKPNDPQKELVEAFELRLSKA